MKMDILVILMVAFGLFAILMFILFYVYAKKYYNDRHLTDEYENDDEDDVEIDSNIDNQEEIVENSLDIAKEEDNSSYDEEFIPIKKK